MSVELTNAGASLAPARALRLGVVGCHQGRARYGTALLATPILAVAGLADTDLSLARAWAREVGGKPPVFEHLSALLAAAPDALLIASSLPERPTQLNAAIEAGIPTLCEFPFAPTLTETDRLLRAAETKGVPLTPALPRRLDPWFAEIARLVANDTLGAIRQARCDWQFPVGGVTTYATGDASGGWASLFQQLACQTTDVCRWWLGAAVSVSADIVLPQENLPSRTAGGRQPRETALANIIVTHERGQSTHHLTQSRAQQPGESYLLSGQQGRLELLVSAGERASAAIPSLTLQLPEHRAERLTPENADSLLSPAVLRIQRLLEAFAHSVRNASAPPVSSTEARAAQEIVTAAFLSTRENAKVSLPLRRSTQGETDI